MRRINCLSLLFLFPLMMAGCKRNPVDRLVDSRLDGIVDGSSGVYMVYDEELKTGGGLAFIPEAGNQTIDLVDQSSPRRTKAHIRYAWNGGDVLNTNSGSLQHEFAGFQLLITPDSTTLDSAAGKDLSAAGYTKLKLFVRGALSDQTKLRIEGPATGDEAEITACAEPDCLELSTLSSDWQEVEVDVTSSRFSNVKIFTTLSFQYDQPPRTTEAGNGGIVYVDDIRYVQ